MSRRKIIVSDHPSRPASSTQSNSSVDHNYKWFWIWVATSGLFMSIFLAQQFARVQIQSELLAEITKQCRSSSNNINHEEAESTEKHDAPYIKTESIRFVQNIIIQNTMHSKDIHNFWYLISAYLNWTFQ